MTRSRRGFQLSIVAFFAAAIGCAADSTPAEVQRAADSIVVTLGASNLTVGQTVQANASVRASSGDVLTGVLVSWASSDSAVAKVTGAGLLTAVAPGTATIIGSVQGKSASATVTVASIPVASVSVALNASTVTVGQTTQATAVARDAANSPLVRTIAWSSSNSAVATVDASGNVKGVTTGSASIVATADGIAGSAPVSVAAATGGGGNTTSECATPNAAWIFCDDFETDRLSSYFEYDNAGGKFARTTSAGRGSSVAMRGTYTTGQSNAGALHLAFGRTPSSYFRPADAGTANYREVYWRFYVRRENGWVGNGPNKLTRAMIFAKSDFSQAMIAHGWTSDSDDRYLLLDPASGTDLAGSLITTGYNDFGHLRWLGGVPSAAPEEDQAHVGQWACYEFHAKLNDAGQSNGIFELTVNGVLSARKTGFNWTGSYNAYGINAIYLENYQNAGAPAANVRVIDNFVVSTQPIGCSAP